MRDVNNNELKVGQTVVFSNNSTSCLYTGKISRFTRFYVIIEDKGGDECKKSPSYVLIIKD